jgi:hypothetical protein
MKADDEVIQKGFLVIADLAGYTDFLKGTKLDHAVDTLRYLFNNILEQIRPPFTISKLEGDAVFAFAPEGSFLQGQTFLDAIEQIYYGYSLAWKRLHIKTKCDCNACKLDPKLELKFVAHYGSYARQDHGQYVELVGYDVNLVHRLLKNKVTERTGLRSYIYLTETCIEALKLGEITQEMFVYSETFPDIGPVNGYVHNLSVVYERESQSQIVYIEREDASIEVEFELPIPPSLAWDYVSEPDHQKKWRQDELLKISGLKKGRMGVGTIVSISPEYAGSIGPADELIADWRPTNYVTYQCLIPNASSTRLKHLLMLELAPSKAGTKVSMRFGTPEADNPRFTWLVRLAWLLIGRRLARKSLQNSAKIVRALVQQDLENRKIIPEDLTVAYHLIDETSLHVA